MIVNWVMFGHSHFFGDLFDLICMDGHKLSKVVLNMPEEEPKQGRLTLGERIGRLHYKVEVENIDNFRPKAEEAYVIGFSGKKMKPLVDDLKRRFDLKFQAMVHRRAILQWGASIADGTIVDAGAIVGPWTKIGNHVVINRGANIGHDCNVGDYSFLAPSAVLCGHVRLGENVFVGANATILPDVQVGTDAVIAAGAVVKTDVPGGVMVAGAPATIKKTLASHL